MSPKPSIEDEAVWDANLQCLVGARKAIRPDGLYWVWDPDKPRGDEWRIYEWCWKHWYTLGETMKYTDEAFKNSKMVIGPMIEVPPPPQEK